jgi:DNA polymerase-3 subunit delta'
MGWENIIGQSRAKNILRRAIVSGQVAHAYLLYGPEGIGKDALAIEFARTLVCLRQGEQACGECASCRKMRHLRHPNVSFICALPLGKNETSGDDPLQVLTDSQVQAYQEELRKKGEDPYHRIELEKATAIKINSVRQIRKGASLAAAETGRKVFIISNAEEMTLEAANSLLKTLEEPPPNTVLVLTSSHKEQLLSTIISRCQVIQCEPLSEEEIQHALQGRNSLDPQEARLVARIAGGSFRKALELTSLNVLAERESVVQFMRLALKSNRLELLDFIQSLVDEHDRPAMIRWLMLLQAWLRDALLIREKIDAGVHNEDMMNDLTSFMTRFPQADLPAAINAVERSIALLDKNSYLPLVLTTLALDLHKYSYAETLFSYR